MEILDRPVALRSEHGPSDMLCYRFEPVSRALEHNHEAIRKLLAALVAKNQAAGTFERAVKQAPIKSTGRGTRKRSRTAHEE